MKHVYKYQFIDRYGNYSWAQKEFGSQKELFRYLVANKEHVISQKKSIIKRADSVQFAPIKVNEVDLFENKSLKPVYENDKEAGILKRTILANTYWWKDSHDDVHIGRGEGIDTAIFTDSIKGRESKIYPIDQHNWSLDGRIGKTLKLYEAPISWRSLGVGKTGMTEGLFAEAEISKSKNAKRYDDYLNDEIDQHSVGMRYNDVELAINDEDEFPKEAKVFKKYINKIGNRQEVEKQGFFFAVSKAGLAEYSCVIAGSNELTFTMGNPGLGEQGKEQPSGKSEKKILVKQSVNELLNALKS
jgi:hypothetical protein